LIFAFGTISRSARSAVDDLRAEGIKAGLFRPITLWPFPERRMAQLARQVKAVLVPEMNLGQMILEIERVVKGACPVSGITRVDGEPITPQQIIEKIKEVH
jgi:2-oxoglutarate ferredoxin oxidoreductase subunit alpha